MPAAIFTPKELIAARKNKQRVSSLFRAMFFKTVVPFQTKEIYLDKVNQNIPIAAFVSPIVEGKVMRLNGYKTQKITPALLKPKHEVDVENTQVRLAGESLDTPLSPEQRRDAIIMQNYDDQEVAINQALEFMAVECVMNGAYTIKDDTGAELLQVDFERSANNKKLLLGAEKWAAILSAGGAAAEAYDPFKDIEDLADQMTNGCDVVILDGTAWSLFRQFKTVKEKLETRRGSTSTLETALKDLGKDVSYKGNIGDVSIVVYRGHYKNKAGQKVRYMPDGSVLLAHSGAEGAECYGQIPDAKLLAEGLANQRMAYKHWITDGDPSVEWQQTLTAPAVALMDADEFAVLIV